MLYRRIGAVLQRRRAASRRRRRMPPVIAIAGLSASIFRRIRQTDHSLMALFSA
jgi:hypothetical protein